MSLLRGKKVYSLLPSLLIVALLSNVGTAMQDPVHLVHKRSLWRFQANGVIPADDWAKADFNDVQWPGGRAPFGFGETDLNTPLTQGYPTYYFRTSFEITEIPARIKKLTIEANYDDAFVAYLNGREITRQGNVPIMKSSVLSDAEEHESGLYETIDVSEHIDKLRAGKNVLAVAVYQLSQDDDDLYMDLGLSFTPKTEAGPELTRGPYLQIGAPTQMVVRWRTDSPTDSRVEYGTIVGNLNMSADDPGSRTDHEITLTGLTPNMTYYYSVGDASGASASGSDYFFVTPPTAGTTKSSRIWVLGDAGTKNNDQRDVRDAYYSFTGSTHTDMWVLLGDNAYFSGTDADYQSALYDMYPEMLRKSVVWPAFGNHEALSSSSSSESGPFYDMFTLPENGEAGGVATGTEAYYSFDYANIHFVCLNSEDVSRSTSGAMLTWLEDDLSANTQDWTIAFWHHPPYSKGSHNSDNEGRLIDMRENALPILEQHGVDLVLSGHSHSYERSFLLDGHYGNSLSLMNDMILDDGDGQTDGDGAYTKPVLGPSSHDGAVYVVAGNGGQLGGGSLDHPAMHVSMNELGSVVLDVNDDQLDLTFIDDNGSVRDYFTMIKGVSGGNPPDAPTGLSASANGASQIDLNWTDNSTNEDGFKIESHDGDGNFAEIATVGANTVDFSDTGLNASTTYTYRVRAFNSDGNSNDSNEVSATTSGGGNPGDNLALNKPVTFSDSHNSYPGGNAVDGDDGTFWGVKHNGDEWLRVDLGNGYDVDRVIVNWDGDDFATDFEIQVSQDDANWTTAFSTGSGAAGVQEFTFFPSQARYVRLYMTAYNDTRLLVNEFEIYGETSGGGNPPDAPTGLAASTGGTTQIDLNWTDQSSDEDGFKIERHDGDGNFAEIATVGADVSTYHDDGLQSSTTYTYRVRAFNGNGDSDYSNEASASTGSISPPAAPSNLAAAAASAFSIELAWDDNSNIEDGFAIERHDGVGNFAEIATVGGDVTNFTDAGLSPNTTYTYRVNAFNNGGDSGFSNEASATTDDNPVDPNVNLALDKPATASSTHGSFASSNINDGDDGTAWGARDQGSDIWARIDLESEQTVGRAIVRWSPTRFATAYEFQISNDDANWTTVYSTTSGADGDQEFEFSQTEARYVRLLMTAFNKSAVAVEELEVYAGPAEAVSSKRLAVSSELKNTDQNGTQFTAHSLQSPVHTFSLHQNYPNPFNPTTTIRFSLPKASQVSLMIFNLRGQLVRTLVNDFHAEGAHAYPWDGRDAFNRQVASGTYLYILRAGEFVARKKMTLLK